MQIKKTIIATMISFASISLIASEVFTTFIEEKNSNKFTQLPDFSYAGYHYSEKPLPIVNQENYKYFDVTAFGAVANDNKSDYDAVKKAIKAAQDYGKKAVIFFPKGKFNIREISDLPKGSLVISKSNIVIKGSGAYDNGTELFINGSVNQVGVFTFTPNPNSHGKRDIAKRPEQIAQIVKWLNPYETIVNDASKLKAGQLICIYTATTKDDAKKIYNKENIDKLRTNFYPEERHEIVEVTGNKLKLREPILDSLQIVNKISLAREQITEVGIEDIAFTGNYRERYGHYFNDSSDGFLFASFISARNTWIRNIRCTDLAHNFNYTGVSASTIMNMSVEGIPAHIITRHEKSDRNLMLYVRENGGFLHGLGASFGSVGNVFSRCSQFAGIEAHGGGPYATLFDLNSGILRERVGGAYPFHNQDLVFWNWINTKKANINIDYAIKPSIIGLHGVEAKIIGNANEDLKFFESFGKPVQPYSLFDAQLKNRLKYLPEWIAKGGEEFEKSGRFLFVRINSPKNFIQYNSEVEVDLEVNKNFDLSQVKSVELWATKNHYLDGDEKMFAKYTKQPFASKVVFPKGTWTLRAKINNKNGEFTYSIPVTIYVGNDDDFSELDIKKYNFIWNDLIDFKAKKESLNSKETTAFDNDFNSTKEFKSTGGSLIIDFENPIQLTRVDIYPKTDITVQVKGSNNPEALNDLFDMKQVWNTIGIYGPRKFFKKDLQSPDDILCEEFDNMLIEKNGKPTQYKLFLPNTKKYRYYQFIIQSKDLHWAGGKFREIKIFK